MASPGNQHCVSCIGTLSIPVVSYCWSYYVVIPGAGEDLVPESADEAEEARQGEPASQRKRKRDRQQQRDLAEHQREFARRVARSHSPATPGRWQSLEQLEKPVSYFLASVRKSTSLFGRKTRYRPRWRRNHMFPARFDHFQWPYRHADQCVRLPAWGFLLVFYGNHGCKCTVLSHRHVTDRRTDGSTSYRLPMGQGRF